MKRRRDLPERSAAGGRSSRLGAAWFLWASLLTWADAGRAQGQPTPVDVFVRVEPNFCSEVEAVQRETTRRSPRLRFVTEDNVPRQVAVSGISSSAREGVGAFIRLGAEASVTERELWAKSCSELVHAVGFLISLTFDPPSPQPALGEPPPTPAENDPPSSTADPVQPPEERRSDAETSSRLPFWDDTPDALPGLVTESRVGLGVNGSWGVAPSASLGAGLFFQTDWRRPGADVGGMFRFEVTGDTSVAESFDGGAAKFRRLSAGLLGGPIWRWAEPSLHLAPAVVVRGGLLDAGGRDTVNPQTYQRPWFELGAALLLGVEVAHGWFLELELAASSPMTRYAFQFEPVVFHHVSPLLAHVGLYTSASF